MNLSDVSKTAIMTLAQRVADMESKRPILSDPMIMECYEALLKLSNESEREQILQWKKKYERGLGAISRKAVANRVRNIDIIANDFLTKTPKGTVIELASGLDTRFWRIIKSDCTYIELDLPEIISLRQNLFKDKIKHDQIGTSVLDLKWIDRVTSRGNSDFLIIAEGLFMYLPPADIVKLFDKISTSFTQSQMVFDIVRKTQTQGFWKKIVTSSFRKQFGLDVSFEFGFKKPSDIESYSKSFKMLSTKKGTYGPIISVSINA